MKRIHLLRYAGEPEALAPLLDAVRTEGLRVGWLEVPAHEPGPVPPALEVAASAGAFRSVAVGAERSVAVKRRAGPPVLRDLLREHFQGCALVVVRAAEGGGGQTSRLAADLAEVPELTVVDGAYGVRPPGEAASTLDPAALAARLRRPRPLHR